MVIGLGKFVLCDLVEALLSLCESALISSLAVLERINRCF